MRLKQSPQALALPQRPATGPRGPLALSPSRLGPRELEHYDLVSTEARDVDLVAVHMDCRGYTSKLEAYTLQDVT
eukprot:scaffold47028_cov87-Phaeocystis_antarctica.AAC.2